MLQTTQPNRNPQTHPAMGAWWRRPTASLLRAAIAVPTPPPQIRPSTATYYTIQALPRERTGTRNSAREREMGRIPAVVLTRGVNEGKGSPVSRKVIITTSEKQIKSLIKRVPSFCATKFALKVRAGAGSSMVLHSGDVLPIKVHKDKDTGRILNVVLEWAEKGSEVQVDIPIVYKGEDVCPGLQKGGYLRKMKTTLRYLCPVDKIPPTVEVDLTNLDIGNKVIASDVPVDSSLKQLTKDEYPVCKIVVAKPRESKTIHEPTKTPEPIEV